MGHKRILLVEDDFGIQDVIQIILELDGYEVESYQNGSCILEGTFSLPDLFILDKQLPHVSGLELCKHIKSQEQTKKIPVLIMSASPQVDKAAIAGGANGFLEKPFTKERLLELVSQLCAMNSPEITYTQIPD